MLTTTRFTDARDRIYVNLQPDQRGPMHRNAAVLSSVETGHNRAPPSQRTADPTRTLQPACSAHLQSFPEHAPEGRKYYAAVIDRQTATELRLPRKSGCSASYKCGRSQILLCTALFGDRTSRASLCDKEDKLRPQEHQLKSMNSLYYERGPMHLQRLAFVADTWRQLSGC